VSVQDRAQSAMMQQSTGVGVETTSKAFLSVRRWRGGELDRGAGGGHVVRMGMLVHDAYTARGYVAGG
jgi:hypothetical protein